MLPAAYISHLSHGRLRVRVPEKRKDSDYFSHIQGILQNLDVTSSVQVTALTASILIDHNVEAQEIVNLAKELNLFDCNLFAQAKETEDTVLKDVMRQPWVIKGLIGLGTLQLLRGQPLAPSSTLFMDALRLWAANHRPS